MRQYKTLGLVWFDKDLIQETADPSWARQDWRIEDNPLAEQAFRAGVHGLTLVSTGSRDSGSPHQSQGALPAAPGSTARRGLALSYYRLHDQL
jgi:hypothetical protein